MFLNLDKIFRDLDKDFYGSKCKIPLGWKNQANNFKA